MNWRTLCAPPGEEHPALAALAAAARQRPDQFVWLVPTRALAQLRQAQGVPATVLGDWLLPPDPAAPERPVQVARHLAALAPLCAQVATGPLAPVAGHPALTRALGEALMALHLAGLPPEAAGQLAALGPDWTALAEAYGAYRPAHLPPVPELAAARQLDTWLRRLPALPPQLAGRTVVLERFFHVSPLLARLLDLLRGTDLPVYLVITHDPARPRLGQAPLAAFAPWVPPDRWEAPPGAFAPRRPPPGLAHLQRHLGAHRPPPAPATDGVEVHRFLYLEHECHYVASRIRTLLQQGVPAGAIAVAVRQLDGQVNLLRRILAEHGVPVAHPPVPLRQTRAGQALATLHRASREGLTHPMACELLTLAEGDRARGLLALVEALDHYLDDCRRREEWRQRLEALARSAPEAPLHHPAHGVPPEQFAALLDWLEGLWPHLEVLGDPAPRPLGQRAQAAAQALAFLGLAGAAEGSQEAARALAALAGGAEAATTSAEGGAAALERLLAAAGDPDAAPPPDLVRILPLWLLEGQRPAWLFLVGATAGRLPLPPREEWPFAFAATPLLRRWLPYPQDLPDSDSHLDRERYLFAAAVAAPSQGLVITWSSGTHHDAAAPSPYLLEVAAALGRRMDELEVRHGLTPWFDGSRASPETAEGALGILAEAAWREEPSFASRLQAVEVAVRQLAAQAGASAATQAEVAAAQAKVAAAAQAGALARAPEATGPAPTGHATEVARLWQHVARQLRPEAPPRRPPLPQVLDLDDLVLLRLCPRRFAWDRVEGLLAPFVHRFHLEQQARNWWLRRALARHLATREPLDRCVAALEGKVRDLWGGLGEASLANIRAGVTSQAPRWIQAGYRQVAPAQWRLPGGLVFRRTRSILWLADPLPDRVALGFALPPSWQVEVRDSRLPVARDWARALAFAQSEYEFHRLIREVMASLTRQDYPAYRGVHCRGCPYRLRCEHLPEGGPARVD